MLLQLEALDPDGLEPGQGDYDQRLRAWAMWIEESVRETDFVARYENQTFAVVLAHTDYDSACVLRNRLEQSLVCEGRGAALIGVATAREGESGGELATRAQTELEESARLTTG